MNAGPRILIVDDQPNIRDLLTTSLRFAGYTAPILFLTAKDDTEDKIIGLTVSGDDYVTKPFSFDEIVARIKAILRRTKQANGDAVICAGELTMHQDTHEVFVGGTTIELSPTEFKLLRYLRLNPNRVLSKAQILDHVWEYDFNGDAGIVESYISYLRRKVDAHSSEPLIQMMPAGLAEAGLTLLPTFLFDSQEEAHYVCARA